MLTTFSQNFCLFINKTLSLITTALCMRKIKVDAIMSIKKKYGVKKNWQGDPCAPKVYLWQGLNCSYDDNQPPRIISLWVFIFFSPQTCLNLRKLYRSNSLATQPCNDADIVGCLTKFCHLEENENLVDFKMLIHELRTTSNLMLVRDRAHVR